jgi:hypothetical protein
MSISTRSQKRQVWFCFRLEKAIRVSFGCDVVVSQSLLLEMGIRGSTKLASLTVLRVSGVYDQKKFGPEPAGASRLRAYPPSDLPEQREKSRSPAERLQSASCDRKIEIRAGEVVFALCAILSGKPGGIRGL